MGVEIERKFLVADGRYKAEAVAAKHIMQAYLTTRPEGTVRVRVSGDKAWITVKGITAGAVRNEWEYPIPVADARAMIEKCALGTVVDKTRHIVPVGGHTWEVDEFHGFLDGLTVAEIELADEREAFALPAWVGREVTGDVRFYNSSLAVGVVPPFSHEE